MRLLLILLLSVPLLANELYMMTEDLKPYNYKENGKLVGISVETVQEVMQMLNEQSDITLYPWARAMNILKTKDNAALFSMSYTKQRAKLYNFACPLAPVSVYFFIHKDSTHKIASLDDIKHLRIGVVKDFAAHKRLQNLGFENFDFSSSTKVMAKKLIEGKIDTFTASPPTIFTIDSLRIDLSLIQQTSLKLYETQLCIAFNKNVPKTRVQKWTDALQEFHKSGKYDKIYAKYMQKNTPKTPQ
ncbi:MAG: substrate-binding periplasmic protein [Campylobacterota bacterium]